MPEVRSCYVCRSPPRSLHSACRYLYRYYREGTLHTARAANAREECRKIKNIAKTVAQVTSRSNRLGFSSAPLTHLFPSPTAADRWMNAAAPLT